MVTSEDTRFSVLLATYRVPAVSVPPTPLDRDGLIGKLADQDRTRGVLKPFRLRTDPGVLEVELAGTEVEVRAQVQCAPRQDIDVVRDVARRRRRDVRAAERIQGPRDVAAAEGEGVAAPDIDGRGRERAGRPRMAPRPPVRPMVSALLIVNVLLLSASVPEVPPPLPRVRLPADWSWVKVKRRS